MLYKDNIFLRNVKILKKNVEVESMLITGDENYVQVNGMEIIQGKNLNKVPKKYLKENRLKVRKNNKSVYEVLVNEEFVKQANLKNPIGTLIYQNGSPSNAKIVGVFKNVMNTPLYNPVKPIVLGYYLTSATLGMTLVQVNREEDIQKLRNFVVNYYKDIKEKNRYKGLLFTYNYKKVYQKDFFLINLLEVFSIIVLVIAILGLIAISLFITQNRTKEIGIRKINGATVIEILKMLNKSFVIWVIIAFIIAVPVSYIIMQQWLQNFAYKTHLSWWVFALAGFIVLSISLLAVSWQTYKAATNNPIKALRDE